MKKAIVNGEEIAAEAVSFELERLVKLYASHGMPKEEVSKMMPKLEERALEQAIGAKLLLDRAEKLDMPVSEDDLRAEMGKLASQLGGEAALEKAIAAQGVSMEDFRRKIARGVKVNKLVEQACASAEEPSDGDVSAFFEAHRANDPGKELAQVEREIKDFLRHASRSRAMEVFVEELREGAKVEYRG